MLPNLAANTRRGLGDVGGRCYEELLEGHLSDHQTVQVEPGQDLSGQAPQIRLKTPLGSLQRGGDGIGGSAAKRGACLDRFFHC